MHSTEIEITVHYLIRYPNYLFGRRTLLGNIKYVLPNILEQNYFC